jgi:hypothetical protein|uniref:Uncharacterized protein n=1 Tax=Dictyoglomus turgidum TaxID=513050 RepID=A0A7C3WME7_9BACT
MKKKQSGTIVAIVIMAIIIGFLYVFMYTEPGIEVSCKELVINGFKKVPPPLLAIYQETYCQVEINAKVEQVTICSGKFNVTSFEKGVFPCAELRNNVNKTIYIEATFFNIQGQIIGSDKKTLKYEGI